MIFEIDTARLLLGIVWQQLWIGSLLVLLVSVCLRLFKSLNAATRHWIWLLTLITLAMLPLPALFPASPATVVAENSERFSIHAQPSAAAAVPSFAAAEDLQSRRRTFDSAIGQVAVYSGLTRGLASSLAGVWLIGTLWMLLALLRGAGIAGRLQRESRPAPLPQKAAEIRLSNLARTPMVVGLRRPSILIPAALFEQASREELQRILEHELAHVRRHDQWLMLMQKLIEALYFFHPAVRYAAARFDDEREISCDDSAAHDQRKHYAGSLIRICRSIVQPQPAALAVGAIRSRNQLTRRIACLMDARRNHTADVSRTSLAMSMLMLIAAMTVAVEFMPRIARAEAAQDEYARSRQVEFGTPLIAASAAGDLAAMRALIESGADVNEAFVDHEPRTPLNAAARGGHLDAVKLLLEEGAQVDRVVAGDATALIDAARRGHVDVVALLLESGADANLAVPGDGSPLIAAALRGSVQSVRLLLAYGADSNLAVPGDGSPIAAASILGDDETIKTLLDHGADPNVLTDGDQNAMMAAAARGDLALLERLKSAGGDVNQVNPGDGTPLIAAARRGSLPAAEWLLQNGADANLASRGDGSPLIMAAAYGHTDIVRLLLDHGADIDAVVPGDETALITSSRSGAIEAVRLLLERGANVNIEVPEGGGIFGEPELRTALNQAEKAGHGEIAALLVAHGASR